MTTFHHQNNNNNNKNNTFWLFPNDLMLDWCACGPMMQQQQQQHEDNEYDAKNLMATPLFDPDESSIVEGRDDDCYHPHYAAKYNHYHHHHPTMQAIYPTPSEQTLHKHPVQSFATAATVSTVYTASFDSHDHHHDITMDDMDDDDDFTHGDWKTHSRNTALISLCESFDEDEDDVEEEDRQSMSTVRHANNLESIFRSGRVLPPPPSKDRSVVTPQLVQANSWNPEESTLRIYPAHRIAMANTFAVAGDDEDEFY